MFQVGVAASLITKILGNGGHQVGEASQHFDASKTRTVVVCT